MASFGTAYKLFVFTPSMPPETVLAQQEAINALTAKGAMITKYEHGPVASIVELKVATVGA